MKQVMTMEEIIDCINNSQTEVIVHVALEEEDSADGEAPKNKG